METECGVTVYIYNAGVTEICLSPEESAPGGKIMALLDRYRLTLTFYHVLYYPLFIVTPVMFRCVHHLINNRIMSAVKVQ